MKFIDKFSKINIYKKYICIHFNRINTVIYSKLYLPFFRLLIYLESKESFTLFIKSIYKLAYPLVIVSFYLFSFHSVSFSICSHIFSRCQFLKFWDDEYCSHFAIRTFLDFKFNKAGNHNWRYFKLSWFWIEIFRLRLCSINTRTHVDSSQMLEV